MVNSSISDVLFLIRTQHQWKPATNSQLTGGPNWQPTGGLTATTLPPSSMYMGPYVQGYGGQPMGVTGGAWGGPMMGNMGMQQPYGVGMGVPTYSMVRASSTERILVVKCL